MPKEREADRIICQATIGQRQVKVFEKDGRWYQPNGKLIPEDVEQCELLGIWLPDEVKSEFRRRKSMREQAEKSLQVIPGDSTVGPIKAKTLAEALAEKVSQKLGTGDNVISQHKGVIFKKSLR